MMKKLKAALPNIITCGNLFCGCLAIVKAFEGDLIWTAYLVGIAAILDFFDGFTARILKVTSAIGKDLDSLADMVTFGVVPGVVMFKLIVLAYHLPTAFEYKIPLIAYSGFIITIFSAIRLAKFNNDTRQSESFIGINTPANSMLVCSIPLILDQYKLGNPNFIVYFLSNHFFLVGLTLLMSFLLVSEIPMFALKFKNFNWNGNEIRFVFILISLLILLLCNYSGIPIVITIYILLSLINNLIGKKVQN
jgi:CDP-diacylglycerol--serine O-phosphatidyltransferase